MTAEKIMSKFLDTNIGRRAVQGVTTAGGAVVAGPVGAMGGAALAASIKTRAQKIALQKLVAYSPASNLKRWLQKLQKLELFLPRLRQN
jgi:hypothetical protein